MDFRSGHSIVRFTGFLFSMETLLSLKNYRAESYSQPLHADASLLRKPLPPSAMNPPPEIAHKENLLEAPCPPACPVRARNSQRSITRVSGNPLTTRKDPSPYLQPLCKCLKFLKIVRGYSLP